jgi:hypothetical protein
VIWRFDSHVLRVGNFAHDVDAGPQTCVVPNAAGDALHGAAAVYLLHGEVTSPDTASTQRAVLHPKREPNSAPTRSPATVREYERGLSCMQK